MLKYLRADLERQVRLEGGVLVRASWPRFIARLLHPRFLPLVICRWARAAFLRRIPLVPQVLTYLNILLFGLEVSPRCHLGPGLFLPHTHGTVLGASEVGENATIFQGVTLGAKELDMGFNPELRPRLGDEVIIGAGAKVLGGIRIGSRVKVGANAVVVHDVPSDTVVVGIPAEPVRQHRGQTCSRISI